MNAWVYLLIGILLEISGTTTMKLSQGFHHLAPSLLMYLFYGFSYAALNLAFKEIDLRLGYAVWCGLGTLLITLISWGLFKEVLSFAQLLSLGLIVIGIIGVRFSQ